MNEIKLVCFDLDDTLINQNSWYKLNLALGVTKEEDQKMYDDYVSGALKYEDWIKCLEKLYHERGLASREKIFETLSVYEIKNGAKDLVSYLKKVKKYQVAIISGSFDFIVDLVADSLGIKLRKANTEIQFDNNGVFRNLVSDGDEGISKIRHLESFCDELSIETSECVCIGDGPNDLEVFKKTGKGITFNDSGDDLKAVAWKTVTDLSEIKDVL